MYTKWGNAGGRGGQENISEFLDTASSFRVGKYMKNSHDTIAHWCFIYTDSKWLILFYNKHHQNTKNKVEALNKTNFKCNKQAPFSFITSILKYLNNSE